MQVLWQEWWQSAVQDLQDSLTGQSAPLPGNTCLLLKEESAEFLDASAASVIFSGAVLVCVVLQLDSFGVS